MALIRNLTKVSKNHKVHNYTDAHFDSFNDGGKKYLQIDTYGSDDRQKPGKVSQSLQIDEEVAKRLIDIIKNEFGI